jgi:hypothetical protein
MYNKEILCLDIYPSEMNKNIYTNVFIAAVFHNSPKLETIHNLPAFK